MHTGPKKGVEKEYEVHFAEIRDNKIRHTFFVQKMLNFNILTRYCISGSLAVA